MDKPPYRLSVPDLEGSLTYVGDAVTWESKEGKDIGTIVCISQEIVRGGPLYAWVPRYRDSKSSSRFKQTIKVRNSKDQIINIKHFTRL